MSKAPLQSLGELSPEAIGKLVSIQVFERDGSDSDSLVYSSLTKYVGVLEAYSIDNAGYYFFIRGASTPIQVVSSRKYVELFIQKEKD